MQNDLRRIRYRAKRGAQIMRKHACKQIPDALIKERRQDSSRYRVAFETRRRELHA